MQVMYMCEPKIVPVAASGKPSPPSLPTKDLVFPLLKKHFGKNVVLHTDGAEAYEQACKQLQAEGFKVVHDAVIHSKGQYTAFGRHEVADDEGWESLTLAGRNDHGELRIRVIKGSQKAEGLWRHLKHGSAAIPEEVHNDDQRLDMYCQALVWRLQTCGCPYRDTLRMCRAFRSLGAAAKSYVFSYGLTFVDEVTGKKHVCLNKPDVNYCRWHLSSGQSEEDEEDEEEQKNEQEEAEGQQGSHGKQGRDQQE